MLREISRVLKPGGRLLWSAPHRDTSWRRRLRSAGLFAFSDADHEDEYSHDDLLELAAGGFVPIGPLALSPYRRLVGWKRAAALRHPEKSIAVRVVARPQSVGAS